VPLLQQLLLLPSSLLLCLCNLGIQDKVSKISWDYSAPLTLHPDFTPTPPLLNQPSAFKRLAATSLPWVYKLGRWVPRASLTQAVWA